MEGGGGKPTFAQMGRGLGKKSIWDKNEENSWARRTEKMSIKTLLFPVQKSKESQRTTKGGDQGKNRLKSDI